MTSSEYESLLLSLKEQFEDENTLDKTDIDYLFEIINTLKQKIDMYEIIIREKRHVIFN